MSDPEARPTIACRGLSIRFGDVQAVDGLDLDVAPGVVFGFLGPNGAGKSTTIRLLLGLLKPDAGTRAIEGHDVDRDGQAARSSCGVLLDDDGLYDRLTAEENLDLEGRIGQMPKAERDARTSGLLEHIGLAERRSDPVAGWSLGMRKKLAVARALYRQPPVVFLDEPTNGLDPAARKALRDDIVSLARTAGSTVFVTTHDLDDVDRMCDRVAVMRKGRLVTEGTPDDLRRWAPTTLVRLRGSGFGDAVTDALRGATGVRDLAAVDGGVDVTLEGIDTSAAPLVRAAVEAGAGIEEVRRADASLEDAYVALMAHLDAADAAGRAAPTPGGAT